jgi:hypothetical protein
VSLPYELLALIFQFSLPPIDAMKMDALKNTPSATPSCFDFAHVCRTWRIVALGNPSLWTAPLLPWPAFAKLMLERARGMPLDIVCYIPAEQKLALPVQEALEAACEKMESIRTLDIAGDGEMFNSISSWFDERPAPILEELRFELEDTLYWRLSRDFLGGYAPRLRLLNTFGISPVIRSPLFAHLTALSICSDGWNVAYGLRDLLVILSRTKQLQSLTLRNVFDNVSLWGRGTYNQTVTLAHLETILLDGRLTHGATILQNLVLPNSVSVRLYHESDFGEIADFEAAVDLVSQHPYLIEGPPLLWPHIQYRPGFLSFEGLQEPLTPIRLEIRAGFQDMGFDPCPRAFRRIMQALPMEDVSMLTVHGDTSENWPGPSAADWADVYESLYELNWVWLNRGAAYAFFAGLELAQLRAPPDDIPLPDLWHIEVWDVDLEHQVNPDRRRALNLFADTLLARPSKQESEYELDFIKCRGSIDPALEAQLESHGVRVQLTDEEP